MGVHVAQVEASGGIDGDAVPTTGPIRRPHDQARRGQPGVIDIDATVRPIQPIHAVGAGRHVHRVVDAVNLQQRQRLEVEGLHAMRLGIGDVEPRLEERDVGGAAEAPRLAMRAGRQRRCESVESDLGQRQRGGTHRVVAQHAVAGARQREDDIAPHGDAARQGEAAEAVIGGVEAPDDVGQGGQGQAVAVVGDDGALGAHRIPARIDRAPGIAAAEEPRLRTHDPNRSWSGRTTMTCAPG